MVKSINTFIIGGSSISHSLVSPFLYFLLFPYSSTKLKFFFFQSFLTYNWKKGIQVTYNLPTPSRKNITLIVNPAFSFFKVKLERNENKCK